MWLSALSADRLRNLKSVDVKLTAGLTLVTGRNGHGKTSLLEAVYLLGTAHSFRTRKLDELVGWQGGPFEFPGMSPVSRWTTAWALSSIRVCGDCSSTAPSAPRDVSRKARPRGAPDGGRCGCSATARTGAAGSSTAGSAGFVHPFERPRGLPACPRRAQRPAPQGRRRGRQASGEA